MRLLGLVSLLSILTAVTDAAHVHNVCSGVKYSGLERDGVELYLGIPYAHDTSGENRFKPPRLYTPAPGTVIDATKPGPACPQELGVLFAPLGLGNITDLSEDCLSLNVARPRPDGTHKKLPVMVWIHGGSFWWASKDEPTTNPEGLIRQSVENGDPVIHVRMNYRLGFFGFATTSYLKDHRSENAGLRDQRLAIEWVRDNIAHFGGDPERITIFGQSSGGLAIGMHILAYGGTKPLPFQRGIAESQANEPGIIGNFSRDAMALMVKEVGCNKTALDSPETISCLRGMDTATLLNASITTYADDIGHNIGDIWLPTVDGDFLPAAPSKLITEGRFGNVTFMSGWMQGDVNYYTDKAIETANDTYNFIRGYLPAMPEKSLSTLLNMYPVEEFPAGKDLAAEFYRSARIFRDILMICPSIHLGEAIHKTHSAPVFFYDFNQTILDLALTQAMNGTTGYGVVHTSEFAYVYDSFQVYEDSEFPFNVTKADHDLAAQASRSWSTYASTGHPSSPAAGSATIQGWLDAFHGPDSPYFMVIGGPTPGLNAFSGADASPVVQAQRLKERCGFLNSPEIIAALQY